MMLVVKTTLIALSNTAPSLLSANVVVQPHIKTINACGLVLDFYGQPIPSASSVMRGNSSNASMTYTNSKGYFRHRPSRAEASRCT